MLYSTGLDSTPQFVSIGDVNNDNHPDIVFANRLEHSVGILINQGNGIFFYHSNYSTQSNSYPQHVEVVDVNNDERLDLVVANTGRSNFGVFLNMGNGSFYPQVIYSTGDESYPSSLVVADLNNDTKPDVIIANTNIDKICIYFNMGNGSFKFITNYWTGNKTGPMSPSVIDIDNDQKLDIVFVNNGTSKLGILFGESNGTFLSQVRAIESDSSPQDVSVVDINNDRISDFIVANYRANNIYILIKPVDEPVSEKYYSTGNYSNPKSVKVVDINNDRKPDIIVANSNSSNILIFHNLGDGTFIHQETYSTGEHSRPQALAIQDVNGDNKPDIIVANSDSHNICVFLAR